MNNYWILFVILCGLLKGTREGLKKAAIQKSSSTEILFFYTLIGFILTIPFSSSFMSLEPIYIFWAFVKAAVCCTAWIFAFIALKKMPISLYGIMDLSRMVFSTLLGVVILGEQMTLFKYIGLVLVIIGLFLANLRRSSSGKEVTLWILTAALLNCLFNAISGVMDKLLLKHIDASQLQFWFMFFMTIIYTVILVIKREPISIKSVKTNYWIPLMSVSLILGDRLLFEANAHPDSQVTVMTVIKQSSVIVTVLTGWIFFKEKNILYKLLCALITLGGIFVTLIDCI